MTRQVCYRWLAILLIAWGSLAAAPILAQSPLNRAPLVYARHTAAPTVTLGPPTAGDSSPLARLLGPTAFDAPTTVSASPQGASIGAELQASISDIQAKLDAVNADTAIDLTLKERLVATYRATLDVLRICAADTEKIATLAKAAALSTDKLLSARQRIKDAVPTFVAPNNADQLGLEEIRQRRTEGEAELAAVRLAIQGIESVIRERESKRPQLPKLIADGRAAIEAAQTSPVLEVEDDPQGTLRAARDADRAAKLLAMRQNVEALSQEQTTIDAEAELLPVQLEVTKIELNLAEQKLRFWSEKLAMQKQYRVENELLDHREQLEAAGVDLAMSLVLRSENAWIELLGEQSRLERKLTREQTRYTELSDTLKAMQSEIERDMAAGRGLRSGLGLKLQMARYRLPTGADMNDDIKGIDSLIDRGRTLQTPLELAIEDSRTDFTSGVSMRPGSNLLMRNGVVDADEIALLRQMKADVDQHLNTLVELKSELELKRKVVSDISLLIDSHVVWIRNNPGYRFSDLPAAWRVFRWIVYPTQILPITKAIVNGLQSRFDLILIWAVFGLALWCLSARLRRRLMKTGESTHHQIGVVHPDDTMASTMIALAITVALAIPPVTTLAVIGYAILEAANKDNYLSSVGSAFVMAAVALFPIETLRQMLCPGGLAIAHFGYRKEIVTPPRTSLRLLIDLGIPLLIVWRIANEPGPSQMDASLGRLIFSFGMVVLAYLLWKALHPATGLLSDYLTLHSDSWTARLKRVWHPIVSLVPIILALLTLVGYSYSATLLTGRLYWTLWLGIAVLVVGGLLNQWFVTYRRRAAVNRKPEKVLQPMRSEGGLIDIPLQPLIDNAEVDAQSLRLIRAGLWLAAIIGTALIWSPVFPAVRFLDTIQLWQTTAADGSLTWVTLANIVVAVPIVLLSFIAVRNIPGLLESVLLEHLPLDRPARYAITTLASYALAVIAILLSARTLGFRWEGIQWLVAALGVGLGFGLQEIFANFVSGLILLFEQPIRVGDVVTIDGVTGTVSRIRMRATAVTNYDRQELIIPNKDLITGRLINWTLTDSTNRLMLKIGIGYGSDTRKACQILEQICAQHQNLLVDPPPVVTFEGFGDSTLNLTVRCFLGSLETRLQTIHELNTTINERFNQEKIELSFPQRDLHIRSLPPQLEAALAAKG